MKTVFLFPSSFKIMGWVFLIPSIVVGIIVLINPDFEWAALNWSVPWLTKKQDNFTNELMMLLVLMSAIIVAFSKTKEEDEYVQKIRLESLVWSIYLNYAVLFIGIIGFYDFNFFHVLIFNMYTPLFLFIGRFHYYFHNR
ncbi:MAG: glucose-6-phosphate-specific signal transduction histidine kinase [Salibacteraceae bacterium]|jgi:glucose-6-phosphate-specific signal transduction histidine kinase